MGEGLPEMSEFMRLQFQLRRDLRRCTYLDVGDLCEIAQIAQILIMPSFEDWQAWDVIRSGTRGEERFILYRTVWRFEIDCEAFASPVERVKHPDPYQPTIEVAQAKLKKEPLLDILQRIGDVRLPPFRDHGSMYLDGTHYELATGRFGQGARLCWHCEMPAEWAALRPLFDEVLGLFTKSLKKNW